MALSDERLAEIRSRVISGYIDSNFPQGIHDVHELLAEVGRLRADDELAAAITRATTVMRSIFWLLVSCVVGAFVWGLCVGILGAPWWVAFGTCMLAGIPIGWLSAQGASDA